MSLEKYKGVIPALYACYDQAGEVSEEKTRSLATHLASKGIKGLYVGGSSGECIYQNEAERKATLKYVASELKGKLTLIAHVGTPSTRGSIELAKYAEELGYDALSAIPPIYFSLPEVAVKEYWVEIMNATKLPFIIYNIPQTTGYNLSVNLLKEMAAYDQVIGVKNSSMPVMDIERFRSAVKKEFIIFNGPDEQYISGRVIGAAGGIGGTYGVMPELFLQAESFISSGNLELAREIQTTINDIIIALCSQEGHMYAVIKDILKLNGVDVGSVRKPLSPTTTKDHERIIEIKAMIDNAILAYKK